MKKTTETVKSMGLLSKYELVVVYPISENEVGVEKQLNEKCKKHGFKVVETDKWGSKPLAYEIKKQVRGYYLKLVIEGTTESAKLLEKDLQMDDKLLRFLMVKI